MKTTKILTIGNSFSRDATCYLHQFTKASGIETLIWNLNIGGCPLERHWENVEKDDASYILEINGFSAERKMSIAQALAAEDWDYISLQQASGFSGWKESYEPFTGLLVAYIREKAPQAKLLMHETWAYDTTGTHVQFLRYHRNQQEMFEKLLSCYTETAAKYDMTVIPCGEIIQKVRKLPAFDMENGGISLTRDGYHMSFEYGRYLLACIWTKKLFGVSLKENTFVPDKTLLPSEPDPVLLTLLRDTVDTLLP